MPGVAATESANNAVCAAALIPLLAPGYPPAMVKRALFQMNASVGQSREPALLPDPAQDAPIRQILLHHGLMP